MEISVNNKFLYCPCYCEENVYRLCSKFLNLYNDVDNDIDRQSVKDLKNSGKYFVIFVSNAERAVPLFHQKASGTKPFVVWDYHVVLMERSAECTKIWDYDTTLCFPEDFELYWKRTLNGHNTFSFPPQFKRKFRVIPAEVYLQLFSSDRSHMLKDGEWCSPPPEWKLIFENNLGNNIDDFISMEPDNCLSTVSVVVSENDILCPSNLLRELESLES